MTPLEAEEAVAAIGLDAIMRGNPSWSIERQNDAAMFQKRARQFMLKAISRREPEPDDAEPPAFDFAEAKKMLEADDDEQAKRHDALYDALPDDIQDAVHAAATRAIEFLQEQLPRRVTKTTARVDVSPPEQYELDRFVRTWRVAVDPMHALRAMADGSLDMVMVAALKSAYPAIYKAVAGEGGILDSAIVAMKTRRGDRWDVTDNQDRQVKILLDVDPIDLDLANEYASMPVLTPAQQARPRSKPATPVAELLPGQKQA